MLVKWGLIRFYEAPWGAWRKEFTYQVIALIIEFWVWLTNLKLQILSTPNTKAKNINKCVEKLWKS